MNKIIEILTIESQEIESDFKKASIEGKGTPQEIADRREARLHTFIKKYFPFPFRVTKGQIIDSYRGSSASIDCLLINPNHPYTTDNGNQYSAILADGVDVAIELKPDLASDTEIIRSLVQIKSVKSLKRVDSSKIPIIGRTKNIELEFFRRIPGVIFSSSTYKEIDLLLKKVSDYYIQNKVPRILQFDMIVINRRCVILNCYALGYNDFKHDGFLTLETRESTLAFFLMLLNRYPKSNSAFTFGKTVLSHYLNDELFDEIYSFTSPYDNLLIQLPYFDSEIDLEELAK